MMSHWFIAPHDIFSPRWQKAFSQAKIVDAVPVQIATNDVVWLLLQGKESFAHIKKLSECGVKVIAMTAIESSVEARQVLETGACGYVHYLAVPELLVQVEQVVAAGSLWLGAELMRQLIFSSTRIIETGVHQQYVNELEETNSSWGKNTLNAFSLLSGREKSVANLVALGKSNKEVARELNITERTVKAHLSAVFEKLHVRDRLQLALLFSSK